MSIRNLDKLFQPSSVAVVGASNRPHSVGMTVMRNLLEGGFAGPVMPVNPKYTAVCGVVAYPDVASLPIVPDLAVICTPPTTVPDLIGALGGIGTRAAIVLTAGLAEAPAKDRGDLQRAMLQAARPYSLRVLGPNCLGLINPRQHLNASFAPSTIAPGDIAFVTQSGALATAVLDWARGRGIGFSHFVSLGNSADVDFGDLIDYLGADPNTRAILLYIEAVTHARKFLSAGRAAARNKHVIAVKAGREEAGARAAASHTGALAGADFVYDAAIRRAGLLRVYTLPELFGAVETLSRARQIHGGRLAILTNGGGPGVMATDCLMERGGELAALSADTLARLDAVLPATWSRANPVDIIGDAPAERYVAALRILAQDPGVDALLLLHCPTAIVASEEVAAALVNAIRDVSKPVLACWLGGEKVRTARRRFDEAGIASYDSPEDGVRGFLQLVDYRRNQETLMQAPAALPGDFTPDRAAARGIIEMALAADRPILSEPEAKAILTAYGIPIVEVEVARTPEEAAAVASRMGLPAVVKVLSPDISHKSDVGGVALNLSSGVAVREAAEAMSERIGKQRPEARIEGFVVEKMVHRPHALELLVGATADPVFGPVILAGQGGTAAEVIRDRAVGLPPLNLALAEELIGRTQIARLLAGYRDQPAADRTAVALALVRIAQLVTDLPEVVELDINPLLADADGVMALDARIRVEKTERSGANRLAIRPYPQELEETVMAAGREIRIRPIRPEDEPQHRAFFERLVPEDVRFRFFGLVRHFHHSQLARYTQIDYAREMAFIATAKDAGGQPETLGVVRAIFDPDNVRAEFAIVVRSDLKGKRLGSKLLDKLIRYCRERGTAQIVGEVLRDNRPMLQLSQDFGFAHEPAADGEAVTVRLVLA